MTKVWFLAFTLALALSIGMVSAHPKGQCTYMGQLYSEGSEVNMDGVTKRCVCDFDGDNCFWN